MTRRTSMKRQITRLRVALALAGLAALTGDGVALLAWRAGKLDEIDLSTILIFATAIGFVAIGTALTYTPGPIIGGLKPAAAEKSLSWRLINNVLLGLAWTGTGTLGATRAFNEGDQLGGYGYVALVLLWLHLAPAMLMGWAKGHAPVRPDPDAELNKAFRAQAMASGFWVLLAYGAAAYVVSLTHPHILRYLLPFGLWLGGSVACAHFVWLHYRADQDLGDDE